MASESATDSQTNPLLQTKFFIPALQQDLVHRERLISLLQDNLIAGDKLLM